MKILYSHRTRSSDGQYVHIEALTRALTKLGHEILICGPDGTYSPGEDAKALDAGNSAPKKGFTLPYGLYEVAELGYNLKSTAQLRAAAAAFGPDVIYERYNLFHHAGALANRSLKIPRLLEVNAPIARERRQNRELRLTAIGTASERNIWKGADAVLPVTQVLGEMLAAEGVPAEKIHVIPNGVDERTLLIASGAEVRSKYDLGTNLVLGFTGFVRDWHGVDRVLDWMASEAGRNAHFLLVGDGPAVPALQRQAKQLGLGSRFVVTGVVQREDVARHVAAFDIALQPAVTAYASPLKLQEYMAQSKAIIAPDQDNIKETVTDGNDVVLVPPHDASALHRALTRLASDSQLRDELGANARETLLRKDMTWAANARRVIKIAEKLRASR